MVSGINWENKNKEDKYRKDTKDVDMGENKIMTDHMVYDNRELSWLKFNTRVLEEAEDDRNPFCERLSFLSIFSRVIWTNFLWYGADRCMIRCICRRRSRITKQE